jgi:uncharacterized protein (DUF302 family)
MATTVVDYGFGTKLSVPFEEAIPRVTDALKAEGFGVLSDIDVQRTLREKLGKEIEPYRILGACNPPLAYQALDVEREVGLLLPCNVVVRGDGDGVRVEIVDPNAMLGVVENPRMAEIAAEARERLQRVVSALAAGDKE